MPAVQAALHDYLHGSPAQGSICSAAFVYGVAESTLKDQVHGNSLSQVTHQASYLFSSTQLLVLEEMIMKG